MPTKYFMTVIVLPYITWQNLTLSYAHQGFDVDWYGVWDSYSEHGRNFKLLDSTVRHTYSDGLNSRAANLTVADSLFNYNGALLIWDAVDSEVESNLDVNGIYFIGKNNLIENNIIKNGATGLSYRANSGTKEASYRVQDSIVRNNDIGPGPEGGPARTNASRVRLAHCKCCRDGSRSVHRHTEQLGQNRRSRVSSRRWDTDLPSFRGASSRQAILADDTAASCRTASLVIGGETCVTGLRGAAVRLTPRTSRPSCQGHAPRIRRR